MAGYADDLRGELLALPFLKLPNKVGSQIDHGHKLIISVPSRIITRR